MTGIRTLNLLAALPSMRTGLRLMLGGVLVFGGLGQMATAAPASTYARSGAVMEVAVNKSQVLRLDRAFAKAAIGNPEIADVVPLTTTSVYVLGKKPGTTNLILNDRSGGLIAVVDVVVGPDTQGLKAQLAQSMPGEQVMIGASNDNVLLQGSVSSPAAAERVVALAESYAPGKVLNMMSVSSPQQVLLEVRIAEVQRGTVKQLGINNFSWGTGTSPTSGNIGRAPDTTENPFQAAIGILGPNINIQFDALEQKGLIRTLAQPNLIALSGETASFLAGGEFPIPTGVQGGSGSVPQVQIEYKQFGVSLSFTPTVLEDGLVNLLVAPEVSSLDREASITLQGFDIPGLKVRRAKTTLELRDGQSFAIAGLIQSDFTDTVSAIPLLGKIPIIGALFRSTSFNNSETELVITVTPRIVRPVRPDQIVLPTDLTGRPSDTDLFLMGKTGKTLAPSANAVKPGGIEGEFGHIVR